MSIIEKEAEQEHSSAQRALAEAFLHDRGKPEDIQQAILWLEKAVESKTHEVRDAVSDLKASKALEKLNG